MGNIQQRTRQFADYMGLTINKFEKMAGLSQGYVKNMVNGYSSKKLEGILQAFPELNRVWLLTGEGSMLKTQSEEAQLQPQPQPQPQPNIEEGRDALVLQLMAIIREQAEEIGRLKAKCGE